MVTVELNLEQMNWMCKVIAFLCLGMLHVSSHTTARKCCNANCNSKDWCNTPNACFNVLGIILLFFMVARKIKLKKCIPMY